MKEILNKYAVYLIGTVFAIAMLYLNSQYVSITTHKELEKRVTIIEHDRGIEKAQQALKMLGHETGMTTIERRVTTKIALIEKLIQEVDDLENEIIYIKAKMQ